MEVLFARLRRLLKRPSGEIVVRVMRPRLIFKK